MPPNLAARNTFFVNYVGTDDAGFNEIGAPWSYLSLAAALAALAAVANPPSQANPWTIALGPGIFPSDGFELPAWVWITGSADDESSDTTEIQISGNVTLHPNWADGAARGGISSLIIRASSGNPSVDFTVPTPTSGNPARILNLSEFRTDRSFTWQATSSADVLRMFAVTNDGDVSTQTMDFISGKLELDQVTSEVPVQLMDAAALGMLAEMNSTFIDPAAGMTIESAHAPVFVSIFGSHLGTLLAEQSGGGTLAITADGISIPLIGRTTLVGTVTVTRTSDAFGEGYTPAVPGNWPAVPTTVQEALDELITVTGGGGFGPGFMLAVGKQGSDSAGNGTFDTPFLTIGKALSVILANADNTSTTPYVVIVEPGFYSEDITIIPWVWICGQGPGLGITGDPTQADLPEDSPVTVSGMCEFDASWNADSLRGGFYNMQMDFSNGILGPNFQLGIIDIISCALSLGFNFLNVSTCCNAVNCIIDGGEIRNGWNVISNCRSPSSLQLYADFAGPHNDIIGCAFHNGIGLNGLGNVCTTRAIGCDFPAVSADGAGSVLSLDASSYPTSGPPSLTSGATLVLLTLAPAVGYDATTPGDWSGTPPASVQEAIDRLAAASPTPP